MKFVFSSKNVGLSFDLDKYWEDEDINQMASNIFLYLCYCLSSSASTISNASLTKSSFCKITIVPRSTSKDYFTTR